MQDREGRFWFGGWKALPLPILPFDRLWRDRHRSGQVEALLPRNKDRSLGQRAVPRLTMGVSGIPSQYLQNMVCMHTFMRIQCIPHFVTIGEGRHQRPEHSN
ncbi:MAG: hypothetical protein IPH00_07540 [Flavobacteriales bacterium]|nr:hypothetical protein [Flavobacteriales bacterium]